jgi:hypothetical protein
MHSIVWAYESDSSNWTDPAGWTNPDLDSLREELETANGKDLTDQYIQVAAAIEAMLNAPQGINGAIRDLSISYNSSTGELTLGSSGGYDPGNNPYDLYTLTWGDYNGTGGSISNSINNIQVYKEVNGVRTSVTNGASVSLSSASVKYFVYDGNTGSSSVKFTLTGSLLHMEHGSVEGYLLENITDSERQNLLLGKIRNPPL